MSVAAESFDVGSVEVSFKTLARVAILTGLDGTSVLSECLVVSVVGATCKGSTRAIVFE